MRNHVPLLVLLLAPALAPGQAQAMDCSKARTAVEKAICASSDLRAKDDEMSALYGEIKAASTEAEQKMLAAAQKKWIAEREDSCGQSEGEDLATCVSDSIDERITLFKVAPQSGPGSGRKMIPTFLVRDGDSKHYAVNVELARFAGPKSPAESIFNDKIAAIAARAPLEPHDSNSDTILESETSLSLGYASPRLVSAAVTWYSDGGAHGNGGVININVDLQKGTEVAITDLLTEEAAANIRKQCRDQIIEQKKEQSDEPYDPAKDEFLSDKVIADHVADLSRWSISEQDVIITFDAYDIGPYVDGDYECDFAMADLKKLAKPDAPLP